MSVALRFSAELTLSETQRVALQELTLKYNNNKEYQDLVINSAAESICFQLENTALSGYIKYPIASNSDDWIFDAISFEGIVLAWLSEVRRTFGGDDWQVYRQDVELVPWLEAAQSYYHDPL